MKVCLLFITFVKNIKSIKMLQILFYNIYYLLYSRISERFFDVYTNIFQTPHDDIISNHGEIKFYRGPYVHAREQHAKNLQLTHRWGETIMQTQLIWVSESAYL